MPCFLDDCPNGSSGAADPPGLRSLALHPLRGFREYAHELVGARPASDRRQSFDEFEVFVCPDVCGVVEERYEPEGLRSHRKVIEVVPDRENVLSNGPCGSSVSGAQNADHRAASWKPDMEIDGPATT